MSTKVILYPRSRTFYGDSSVPFAMITARDPLTYLEVVLRNIIVQFAEIQIVVEDSL